MKNYKVGKLFRLVMFFCIFLMIKSTTSYAGTLSLDINGIDENKYPGIKSQLQVLQNNHPNYSFKIYYTGLDWTEAVTMEYQGHGRSPKNLFSASRKLSRKVVLSNLWF